jgi:hypothetical protein
MKKLILLTGVFFCFTSSFAQVTDAEKITALNLLQKNKASLGLAQNELDNSIVANTYKVSGSDLRMLYLQQSYMDIPVYNQLNVVAFRNDQMVSNTGGRISGLELKLANRAHIPAINSETAVMAAMAETKVTTGRIIIPVKTSANGKKLEYGNLDVSSENITSELMWFPVGNGNELKLTWQIFIAPLNSSDYWLIRVDAATGKIINKESLTIYCNWDKKDHSIEEHLNNHVTEENLNNYVQRRENNVLKVNQPFVVNNATYRVIPYPAESPSHPGGTHALRTNPWTLAPGNPTSLGWQFDGTTYYNNTRGNNVYAYEDRNADNLPGLSANSSTAQPDLTFDFTPDYLQEPVITSPAPNQQFNTTNLFYWNNLIHDLSYIYGFTESARNFQNDNQGRGGSGGDYVLAEAQDGSGTNNANFSTPADGGRGRMQMYLWTAPTPDRDGDVDNGIILHEYTHGISNRLTGSGIGCLSNVEQMGEGWSDYFALMMTHDWASALPGDGFSKPRGIGTYALNQPITGAGIRQYRYTTDMSVNPMTYSNLSSVAVPHGVGTIWCTALWDMTWFIIQEAGINPSLHNISANGGNAIALKLVTEGMRLQPCSPGFIDGRNAILKADTLFFGAQYSCAILNAFARRGMGIGASQGSSNTRGDETISFVGCTPGACNAPGGLTSSAITTNSATVSWSAVSGAVSYDVDYKRSVDLSWSPGIAGTTATSLNLADLFESTLYDWRVRTNCASSSSSYSQTQFTTATISSGCQGIYDVATNGTTGGALSIPLNTEVKGTITPANDNDYYRFHITTGGIIIVTLTNLPANYQLDLLNSAGTRIGRSTNNGTANETINATVATGDYFARVYPKANANNSTLCYTLNVATGTASFGAEETIVNNRINVFPNPASKTVTVNIPDIRGLADIRLFDMYGRKLVQKNSNQANTQLDVSSFASGVYIIKVKIDGKESNIKIVKE